MLGACVWLALEVKYLDPVVAFYRDRLALPVRRETDSVAVLDAGESDLILRRPESVPRGGLHTHYAFSIPAGEYDDWYDRLAADLEVTTFDFGQYRSLYCYDPEGNCVELGQTEVAGPGIDGVFEVVLEVADLARAQAFYTTLGFEVVDDGDDRARVRLSTGALDLELWEPQLGIADGRGGVHVDWGLGTDDPEATAQRVSELACEVETVEEGVRVWDRDGHALTLVTDHG